MKFKEKQTWTSSGEIIFHRLGTCVQSCEVMCWSWMALTQEQEHSHFFTTLFRDLR